MHLYQEETRMNRPFGSARLTMMAAGLAVLMLTGACAQKVVTRGNMPKEHDIAEIKPGVHTKADVAQILGTPSSSATFDKKTWYYIGKTTKRIAFLNPETLESKILVVKFDDNDRVTQISAVDRSAQQEVEIVDRETPTPGKEKSLLVSLYDTLLRGFGNSGPNRGFEK